MTEKRYIKKTGSKHIYHWTPELASRSDAQECDVYGKPIVPKEVLEASVPKGLSLAGSSPEADEKPEGTGDQPPTPPESTEAIQITEEELKTADRATLVKVAKSLKLKVAPASGDDKIRAKIAATLFPKED